jgi:hypothetical protein
MSVSIDVTIFRGETKLKEASDKPVRKTPDETSGVVYGGAVYPLRTGNIIDLDDDTYSKTDCGEFYENFEDIVYYEPPTLDHKWSLEFNSRAKYVVFDGDDLAAKNLFKFLQEKGIANRLGESFRPASDGYHYDWFIRLNATCTEQLARRILSEFSFPSNVDGSENSAQLEAAKNVARIIILNDQVASLGEELKKSKQLLTKINSEFGELQRSAKRKDSELRTTIVARDSYKNNADTAKRDLRKYLTRQSSIDPNIGKKTDTAEEQAKENEAYLEQLAAENEQVTDENRQLKSQIAEFIETGKSLESRLRGKANELKREKEEHDETREIITVQKSTLPSSKQSKTLRNFISQVFEVFIPRIQLQQEDLQCLIQEIAKPKSALRMLKLLNDQAKISKTKSVIGYDGVFEIEDINVGNPGKAGMGRIYYKKRDGNLDVGLHIKKDDREQARFLSGRFN